MNDRPGETAWFSRYEGLSAENALELAKAEGRTVRVITPETVTLDTSLVVSRLNVWLDDDGMVLRMHPG